MTRLKSIWQDEYQAWSKRSLAGKRYVYVWADGVHFNIRLEEERQCILVLMGATPDGDKEVIAISEDYRESEQSWRALLLDCKERSLEIDPELAIADGALGFWKALRKVWSKTREQRCWVHKTANVPDKIAKGQQPKAKEMLHDIWMAASRVEAIDGARVLAVRIQTPFQPRYSLAARSVSGTSPEVSTFLIVA